MKLLKGSIESGIYQNSSLNAQDLDSSGIFPFRPLSLGVAPLSRNQNSLALCGQNLWDRSPDRELAMEGQDHLNRSFPFWRIALFPDWSRVPQDQRDYTINSRVREGSSSEIIAALQAARRYGFPRTQGDALG